MFSGTRDSVVGSVDQFVDSKAAAAVQLGGGTVAGSELKWSCAKTV